MSIVHLPHAQWPFAVAVDEKTGHAFFTGYLSRNMTVVSTR